MLQVADVAEAVPLRALLGIVVVEHVVEAEQAVRLEARQYMLGGLAFEQRRVGIVQARVEAEIALLDLRAAWMTPFGVRKLRHPRSSSSPNTPQQKSAAHPS